MKIYWLIVVIFYFLWVMISHEYPDPPSWWSIFTSNRSTHTSLMEEISLIKVTFTALIFLGLAYLLGRTKVSK